jgi:hypothetical protein
MGAILVTAKPLIEFEILYPEGRVIFRLFLDRNPPFPGAKEPNDSWPDPFICCELIWEYRWRNQIHTR